MEQSAFGRVVSVLMAPRRTFEALAAKPTWLPPFLLLLVLGGAVGLLVTQKIDMRETIREQMGQRGAIDEQKFEEAVAMTEKFGSVFAIGGVAVSAGLYFALGLIFWVAFRMMGSDIDYIRSLATTLHAMVPNAIAALLAIPVILSRETIGAAEARSGNLLASSLAIVAGEDSGPALRAFLGSLDVFAIWSLVLLALGFQIVGRVSRATSWAVVVVLWLVYVLAKVGLSALFS
jgi:hypothetical protein